MAKDTRLKKYDRSRELSVNGKAEASKDHVLSGRQILALFDFHPADEHVLVHLKGPGSVSVGLDEPVDLKRSTTSEFYAWQSDRIFRFTISGVGAEWGTEKISEPELRRVGNIEENLIIVLERTDEPDLELGETDVVNLDDAGTERFRTISRLVSVCFDDKEEEVPRGVYTTEQLLERFGAEPGYVLNLVDENGEFHLLKPDEKVKIKEGLKFVSQVPYGEAA